MKTKLKTCCAAEKLKYRHTLTSHLFWIMPLATVMLSLALSGGYVCANSYNWWYMFIFPGMISLVCCMVGQKDKKSKNRAVLSMPLDLKKVWDSKAAVCIKMAVLSNVIITLAIWGGGYLAEHVLHMGLEIKISAAQGITVFFVLTATCLWQIPLCLLMQQCMGFVPAFVLNMALSSWSGINVSLSPFWFLNPYAVPARLMCAVIGILPNNLIAREGSFTFRPEFLDTKAVLPGTAVCLVWLFILCLISREWYARKGAMTV